MGYHLMWVSLRNWITVVKYIFLAQHNVKIAVKPFQSLSQLFPKPKDKLDKQQMKGVYIQREDCKKKLYRGNKTTIKSAVKWTQNSSDLQKGL